MTAFQLAGQDWTDLAACLETDAEAFFPEHGAGTSWETNVAKRICRGCEVQAECLDWAIKIDAPSGIWGGLTEGERRKLKRQRAAAGPAPDPLPAAPDGFKACRGCRAVKPLDEFYPAKGLLDGRASQCKQCASETRKKSRRAAKTPRSRARIAPRSTAG